MKGIFNKIATLLLSCVMALSAVYTEPVAAEAGKRNMNYLFAGFDDAAMNTDVLMLISLNPDQATASVIQIPRDTYYDNGTGDLKINGLYPIEAQRHSCARDAMGAVSDRISKLLGVRIDGFVAVTTTAFYNFVDAVGGIFVDMPADLEFTQNGRTVSLKKGENLLDADLSLAFVRHRKSYPTGDLGRLDAQKIFIDGVYHTLTKRVGYDALLASLSEYRDGVITNVSILDVLITVLKHTSKFRDLSVTYLTLPGTAVIRDGISFYVLNRAASIHALDRHIGLNSDFDGENRLFDPDFPDMKDVYYKGHFRYPEYIKDKINYIVI